MCRNSATTPAPASPARRGPSGLRYLETLTSRTARDNHRMAAWNPDPDPRWFTRFKLAAVIAVPALIVILALCT